MGPESNMILFDDIKLDSVVLCHNKLWCEIIFLCSHKKECRCDTWVRGVDCVCIIVLPALTQAQCVPSGYSNVARAVNVGRST